MDPPSRRKSPSRRPSAVGVQRDGGGAPGFARLDLTGTGTWLIDSWKNYVRTGASTAEIYLAFRPCNAAWQGCTRAHANTRIRTHIYAHFG
jgi:hypothetical protein